jgi:hypothetical protein
VHKVGISAGDPMFRRQQASPSHSIWSLKTHILFVSQIRRSLGSVSVCTERGNLPLICGAL